jgi:hypothetical protein
MGCPRQNMAQTRNEKHQEEWKELTRNSKGQTVGRQRKLETFRPLTHIKRNYEEEEGARKKTDAAPFAHTLKEEQLTIYGL